MLESTPQKGESSPCQFEMPPFYMPFPQEINQLESPREAILEWATRLGLLPTATARARFEATRTDLCTKASHPTADRAFLELMAEWYSWLFLFDDPFDDGPLGYCSDLAHGILEPFLGVLNSVPPPTDNPLAQAFADLWNRTTAWQRSAAWLRRYRRDAFDYLDSYRVEMLHREDHRYFGVNEYISHRIKSFAGMMVYDMFEIAADADLPDHVIDCESFQALRRTATLIPAFQNDIIALEKELACDYPYNLVLVIRNSKGCSLQEAVILANAMATEQVEVFLAALSRLPDDLDQLGVDAGTKAAALRTVREYQRGIRGFYDWSLKSARYGHVTQG